MLKKYTKTFIKILSNIAPHVAAALALEGFQRPRRFGRTEQELAYYKLGQQIKFASGRIANIWGDDGSPDQPLVFLCHGWESRGTTFHVLSASLVKKGFKVIAWNAPAHGASPGKKTQFFHMVDALVADLASEKLKPVAFVGHSMGGALLSLLHKYIELPKALVIISAPTNIMPMFKRVFSSYNLNPKTIDLVFKRINQFGEFTLEEISLINSDLYKTKSPLVIHDKNDKEIPFSEFENLQKAWPTARFHPTENLGHRRILRDEALANIITAHIIKNS